MLLGDGTRYVKVAFANEAEIELVVTKNAELLFGAYAIFLPKTKISTLGKAETVPDGLVIDLQGNQWYLVEAERAAHGTWEHIAPQVSKQLTALSREETREKILRAALDLFSDSPKLQDAIRELEIKEVHLHGKISGILRKPPSIAIPIDEIPSDLAEWARTLKNPVRIWRIEKYSKAGGSEILYSFPDEAVATTGESPESSEISDTRFAGGELLRRVLRAGLLHIGQELHMEYGPKGKPKQRFTAIVSEDGLEVDGKVYSPSYAAVACMRKAGSDRETANGWLMWRTTDGVLIDELFKQSATGS